MFMRQKLSVWILLISLLLTCMFLFFFVSTIFALNLFVLWAFCFFNILLVLCCALKTFIPWSCGKIANHNWKIHFLVYFRWLKDWHSLNVPSSVFLSGKNHFLKIPEPVCLCHVCSCFFFFHFLDKMASEHSLHSEKVKSKSIVCLQLKMHFWSLVRSFNAM